MEFWMGVAMTLLVESVALIAGRAWLRKKLGEARGGNAQLSPLALGGTMSPDRGARGGRKPPLVISIRRYANELENRGN